MKKVRIAPVIAGLEAPQISPGARYTQNQEAARAPLA